MHSRLCHHDALLFPLPADHYDVIIVDSSDPVGPAEVLFEKVRVRKGEGSQVEGTQL
jgi:hypothetical protein